MKNRQFRNSRSHLINIYDKAEYIAEAEHQDNSHENHCDVFIALLPARCFNAVSAGAADGAVDAAVGHTQHQEGDQRHDKEVGEENVVADITCVSPHLAWADCIILGPGHKHQWIILSAIIH